MKHLLLFLILSCISFVSLGQEVLFLNSNTLDYKFDHEKHLKIWSERELKKSTSKLSSDYFLSDPPGPLKFEETTYDDQILWVKAKIHTPKDLSSKRWLLRMQPSDSFFKVDVFDGKGDLVYKDLTTRTLENAQVEISVEPDQDYSLIIHCARSNFISFNLMSWSYREGQLQTKEFDSGFFFGALGVLLIYTLFIFFSVKEIYFIYYACYLGSMILVLGIIGGIFPLNQILTTVGLFTTSSFFLFTHSLLSLSLRFPKIRWTFIFWGYLGVVLAILAAFPPYYFFIPFVEYFSDIYILLSLIFMIGFAGLLTFQKKHDAYLYLIAWSPLFFAFLFYLARVHIFKMDSNYWDLFALRTAVLTQSLIFTGAFTYRVKRLQIDNAIQTEKAKDAERLRNLVRVICHDIANPLTVIQAYSSFKKDDPDTTWALVNKASDKICDLVTRIKTLQALESRKQKLNQSAVAVERFLSAIQDTFEIKFKEKNIQFVVEASPELLQTKILVDPVLFESTVINNIVSNAIKFSFPQSSIFFRLKDEPNKMILEFEDHGLGIPKKLLEKIFSPSEKTSRIGTQGEKGTGFGMPLIKGLLESMEADLILESESLEDNPSLPHGKTILRVIVYKA